MEKMQGLKPTGTKFPTPVVYEGHKRGVLCLRCGKFAEGLICASCKDLEKCKLCGIICRPVPLYRLFYYVVIKKNKAVSIELFRDVKPICQKLEEGLCEDCVCWEDFIKNECFICDTKFQNSFKNFKENGNCCPTCNSKIKKGMQAVDRDEYGNPTNANYFVPKRMKLLKLSTE